VKILARVGAGHDREFGCREIECLDPAGFHECDEPERLDRGSEVDDDVGVAQDAEDGTVYVDLDDGAAMSALDDATANLADENRRGFRRLMRSHRASTGADTG
jgi:hypothetical protein